MTLFQIAGLLIASAALFSFVNLKLLRLPMTIGVMLLALTCSLATAIVGRALPGARDQAVQAVASIDFQQVVLHAMLAFLLFAGSIQLDFNTLRAEASLISILAIGGTFFSTGVIAGLSYLLFIAIGMKARFIACLLLGAIISPTDPISVLGIMKRVKAPKTLEAQLAGESLFNDGIGVVIFVTLLEATAGGQQLGLGHGLMLLAREVGGGVIVGLVGGFIAHAMIRKIDHYQVEVLLTLALAMGCFGLADAIHVSAPIAVVVAGLFIGNIRRTKSMSRRTRAHLHTFWELIDDTLNAVLFLMIGLEALVLPFSFRVIAAGLVVAAIALIARLASVSAGVAWISRRGAATPGTVAVLTWGGLRGGLAVAMALALPASTYRDLLLCTTYIVVLFSVFVQGLTIAPMIRKFASRSIEGQKQFDSTSA